jgi:hypothetical protein
MLLRFTSALLLSTALLTTGCETRTKCADACPDTPQVQLQNVWTWQRSTGGIAGGTQTPASSGQQRKIEFDPNGTVRFYTNGQLTRTDTYTVQPGSSIRSGQTVDMIHYGTSFKQSFQISGKKLLLWDEVYDGYESEYQR